MRVKFIGTEKRTNSYGTFLPGKTYDVPDNIGVDLLTCPLMFLPDGVPDPMLTKNKIIEVEGTPEKGEKPVVSKYAGENMGSLIALCRKKNVMLTKGLRKAQIVALLDAKDAETV